MDVQRDTGGLLAILHVFNTVKKRPVTSKLDIALAVNLAIGETYVISCVQYIVQEAIVTNTMVNVIKDAHKDNMDTRVIKHVVLDVKEWHVTNRVGPAVLDVNRT